VRHQKRPDRHSDVAFSALGQVGELAWCAAIKVRKRTTLLIVIAAAFRIASPEMFPEAEMLPHLICSRPMFIGGANDEAD
jgi:hypothetical protein